ncbi:MAG TPA: hypothetical protein VFI65_11270 [Streptosporangiaceae bacterium]|nr:hypothetical protein [Streptosporangiaceae bacterium]
MGSDPMPAAVASAPGKSADRSATAAVTALYQASESSSRPGPPGSASAYIVTAGQATKIPGATWPGQLNSYLPASW